MIPAAFRRGTAVFSLIMLSIAPMVADRDLVCLSLPYGIASVMVTTATGDDSGHLSLISYAVAFIYLIHFVYGRPITHLSAQIGGFTATFRNLFSLKNRGRITFCEEYRLPECCLLLPEDDQ